MRYGSVCSGIEAATVAWHPLGWKPVFFSEIEAFPSAVLKHHYPHVPNLGDMTKFQEWPDEPIDLLVGGTPCQSFSVAGLRAGLADPRGNLLLTYLAIAARYRPRWLVWENVPGVLSSTSHDAPDSRPPPDPLDLELDGQEVVVDDEYDAIETHAFGTLLAGLSELGYGFAYRVLDAQFCRAHGLEYAVPQRRRRVFVVGCLGSWAGPAAVFLDAPSLRGDSPPRREAGKGIAPTISARPTGGGGLGTDFDLDGGLDEAAYIPDISVMFMARDRKGPLPEADLSTVVAHALRAEGFDASEDGTGRGTPLVPVMPVVPIAFGSKDHGGDASEEVSPARSVGGFDESHANAGVPPAVAYGIRADAQREGDAKTLSPDAEGKMRLRPPGMGITEGVAPTVDASQPHAVAFGREQWAVRRLTPVECCRLQGFPDDYLTQVRFRTKPPADGPMYKALGNSMAVNVMRIIGERIAMVDEILDLLD
jgi:DNA (cytosine-5)-methyltransferase 1